MTQEVMVCNVSPAADLVDYRLPTRHEVAGSIEVIDILKERFTRTATRYSDIRDKPFLDLKAKLDAGEITAPQYGDRLDQLVNDTFGDPGDSIQVNRGKD